MFEQPRAPHAGKQLSKDERLLRILSSRGRVVGVLFAVTLLTLGAGEIAGRFL